ncbi:MAG: hypothetical protein ACKVVT_09230 [Dehalococcoidia bacterium]
MERLLGWQHGRRRASLALLFALLPMLTFVGHWPEMEVSLPGGAGVLRLPGGEPPHSEEGDHARHCHAGVASCGDQPPTGSVPLAVLGAFVDGLPLSDAFARALAESTPLRASVLAAEPPPPRSLAL